MEKKKSKAKFGRLMKPSPQYSSQVLARKRSKSERKKNTNKKKGGDGVKNMREMKTKAEEGRPKKIVKR